MYEIYNIVRRIVNLTIAVDASLAGPRILDVNIVCGDVLHYVLNHFM